jgi:hypothetical protein
VAGLFGPQSGVTSSHVQSICDALEIPHIETRWDYRLIRDDYSVNLYPHPQALGEAFAALIQVSFLSFVKHLQFNINDAEDPTNMIHNQTSSVTTLE